MTVTPLTSEQQAWVDELREYAYVVARHDVPIRAYRLDELADVLEAALRAGSPRGEEGALSGSPSSPDGAPSVIGESTWPLTADGYPDDTADA